MVLCVMGEIEEDIVSSRSEFLDRARTQKVEASCQSSATLFPFWQRVDHIIITAYVQTVDF